MANKNGQVSDHVGPLLSGYIDGELTQQERQRVDIHCHNCEQCRTELLDIRSMRKKVGQSRLSEYGEDKWRESMNDATVKTARIGGWLLLLGGILGAVGIAVLAFLTDPGVELSAKIVGGAIYAGLAVLFVSVLRQRLIERKPTNIKMWRSN